MAKSHGGPFFKLIDNHLRAGEYSFAQGDYENAISHMKSLAELLNVDLPQAPFSDPQFLSVRGGELSNRQRSYVVQYRPLVARAVRKWMDAHSQNGIGLWNEEGEEEVSVKRGDE